VIESLARGLVLRHTPDGPVVLCCRSVKRAYLYLPGGHVEFGEPATEALRREFDEETGLACRVGPCALVAEQVFQQRGVPRHEYTLVFHVEHLEGEDEGLPARERPPIDVPSREAKLGFDWVALTDLASVDLRPRAIRGWLERGAYDGLTWLGAESVETAKTGQPPRSS
jgi:8-oxo-dGTP diphosphatase